MIKLIKKGKNLFLYNNENIITLDLISISPFGIEYYNNNRIINFEFSNETNEDINFIQEILIQEKKIIEIIPEITKKNKQFISCIRNGKKGKLLKTYIWKNTLLPSLEIKNKKCKLSIQFTHIWITQTSYGIMININKLDFI